MRHAVEIVSPKSRVGPPRRWIVAVCLLATMLLAALPATLCAQNFGLKNLEAKVYDAGDAGISCAKVKLTNSRNNVISTFHSDKERTYRYADIFADTDFTVWAADDSQTSPTKTVSSLDLRK